MITTASVNTTNTTVKEKTCNILLYIGLGFIGLSFVFPSKDKNKSKILNNK